MNGQRLARIVGPVMVGALVIALWRGIVWWFAIPPYVLPGPWLVAETLLRDGPSLLASLLVTLRITVAALAVAVALGGSLAVLFSLSKTIELSFF
ncbi:MAG: hypothetical protein ACREEN_04395, partial [Stellaceae bacterium]